MSAHRSIEFDKLPRPVFHWSFVFLMLAGAFAALDYYLFDLRAHSYLALDLGKLLFIYYTLNFLAFWIVYFFSGKLGIFRTQSLRLFLQLNSRLWLNGSGLPGETDPEYRTQLSDFREKGKNAITVLALFMAIALLVIAELYGRLEAAENRAFLHSWENATTTTSILLAMSAFVLFLLSIDAIETTFNNFVRNERESVMYFSALSLRPKYYGLVFVILSLIFFVGSLYPALGAFGIALLLSVGYSFWFPDQREKKPLLGVGRVFRTVQCLAPLIVAIGGYENFLATQGLIAAP